MKSILLAAHDSQSRSTMYYYMFLSPVAYDDGCYDDYEVDKQHVTSTCTACFFFKNGDQEADFRYL